MADVTVLMVGGRRCGKSSILASMESILINNPALTNYVKIGPIGNHDLHIKKAKLQSFMDILIPGAYYLVDFDASTDFNVYTFKVSHPKAWVRDFTIDFVDCPGETFGNNPPQHLVDRLNVYKKIANIFLIVVDTPYLMEADKADFEKVNLTMNIAHLFDDIKGLSNDDYRKIIFVPIKCEKWRNNLNDVADKLTEYYDAMFGSRLPYWQNVSYNILPVFTAGGIEFGEFSDPQSLAISGTIDPIKSCCKKQGTSPIIRMYNGESLVFDPARQAIVKNTTFIDSGIPKYSWFQNTGGYKPWNCDQIAYHVIRFALFYMLAHHTFFHFLAPSKKQLKLMLSDIESHLFKKEDTSKGMISCRDNEKSWVNM